MMTKCWFKNDDDDEWEIGEVLSWSVDIMRLRNETLLFPIAIVRCADGHVQGRFAKDIRLEEPEDLKSNSPPIEGSVYEWLKKNLVMPESSDVEHDNRPANKSHRFRPRMRKQWGFWLVMVHQEVIEVFNEDGEYLCQARWINERVEVSRGGIPLVTIQMMFEGRA